MEDVNPNDELYAILKGGGLNKKTKKESKLLQNKQKREKKQKSNIARWMQSVYKVKNPDPGAIKSLIEKDFGSSPDEPTVKIMDILSKAKVINGTLSLSDNFANEPIITFISFNYKMSIFSNDGLFNKGLLAIYYNTIKKKEKELAKSKGKEKLNDWDIAVSMRIPMCKISEVYCISNTFIMQPTSVTEKGYYQDFKADESFIGFNPLKMTKENIMNVLKGFQNKTEFLIDREPYIFFGDAQRFSVVVPKSMEENGEQITQDILNTKLFSITKKPFELGLKEIKIKDKHAYYMDMKYKLENFCPAYLKTGQGIDVKMGFKIVYDLNDLFNYLEGCFKNKLSAQRDLIVRQTIFWNSLDTYFDLIGLLGLVGDFSNKLKEDLVSLYGRYFELKYLITEWKKNQLLFKTILKEFYNIFGSVIMYDKIGNLLKKVDKYIATRNELELYDDSDNIRRLFSDVGEDLSCLSFQMKQEVMSLVQAIKGILVSLSKGTFEKNVLAEIRQIGQAIYQMSLFGERPYVDIVVSPGAFLGKLYDSALKISDDILDAVIGKYVKKLSDEEKKKFDRISNYKTIKKNINKYRDELVRNATYLIITNSGWETDKEKFANKVVNEINWNPDVSRKIEDYIIQEYYVGNEPNASGIYATVYPYADIINKRMEQEKSEEELRKKVKEHKKIMNNLKESEDDLSMDVEKVDFMFGTKLDTNNTKNTPYVATTGLNINPTSKIIPNTTNIKNDNENYFEEANFTQNEIKDEPISQSFQNIPEVNTNIPKSLQIQPNIQNASTGTLFQSNIPGKSVIPSISDAYRQGGLPNPPRKSKRRIKVIEDKMYEVNPENTSSMKTFYPTHTTDIVKTSSINEEYLTEKQVKSGETHIKKKSPKKEIIEEAENLLEKKNDKISNISTIKVKESKPKAEESKPKTEKSKPKTQLDKLIEKDKIKEKELDEMINNLSIRKSNRRKYYGDREEEYGDTESSFIEKDIEREPVRFEEKPKSFLSDFLESYENADDKDNLVIRGIKFNEKALQKIGVFYHNLFRMFQDKKIFPNFEVPYYPREALPYIAKYAPISDVTLNYILDLLNKNVKNNLYEHIDKMLEHVKNNKLSKIYVRFPYTLSTGVVPSLRQTMLRESKQWVKSKIPQAKENFKIDFDF